MGEWIQMRLRRWILTALFVSTVYAQGTLVNGSRTITGTVNYCTDAGASDAYTCNLSPAITAYVSGACYRFKANTANTGTATLALNGLSALTIYKLNGGITTTLADNDIRAQQVVEVCYDGTNLQMQSQVGNAPAATNYQTVKVGGSAQTQRAAVNLIAGTNVTITPADDAGNNETDVTIAASGSGGSPVNAVYWPLPVFPSDINTVVAGAAGYGTCHAFTHTFTLTSGGVGFRVNTASGTSCTGGVCGFLALIYDSTKTLIASTEAGYSGHGTSTKNINTTGYKELDWSSGSAVSAGTLTLTPGRYYICTTSDSTALYLAGFNGVYYTDLDHSPNSDQHGYKAGISTGNGASITGAASWSGTLTRSGNGEEFVQIKFVP